MLVTEQPGRLRVVTAQGTLSAAVSGLPAVDARNQGGLLDVALDPRFSSNHLIYWSYAEPREGGLTNTAVARGTFVDGEAPRVEKVQVIYHQVPSLNSTMHYGSRLVWNRDGTLFVTQGERSITPGRMQAQRMDSLLGKIVRINADGTIPRDNPFVDKPGVRPEIWSLGHRNVQAAALDAQGRLWEIEHGAQGGDELNRVERGKNYGWPLVTYGEEYSGSPILGSSTARSGFEQPVYYWDPVIAPSGAQFYSGDAFPAWRGNLFVGALREQRLVRLVLENDRVAGEEHLLTERGQRIRDVRQGADGSLYVVTDERAGELWKIVPRR